jgi:hypothetical protein
LVLRHAVSDYETARKTIFDKQPPVDDPKVKLLIDDYLILGKSFKGAKNIWIEKNSDVNVKQYSNEIKPLEESAKDLWDEIWKQPAKHAYDSTGTAAKAHAAQPAIVDPSKVEEAYRTMPLQFSKVFKFASTFVICCIQVLFRAFSAFIIPIRQNMMTFFFRQGPNKSASSSGGASAPSLRISVDKVVKRFENIPRRHDTYSSFFSFSRSGQQTATVTECAAIAENGCDVSDAWVPPATACRRLSQNELKSEDDLSRWGSDKKILTIFVEIQQDQKLWVGAFLFAFLPRPGAVDFDACSKGPDRFCTSYSASNSQFGCCHHIVPFGSILDIKRINESQHSEPDDGIFGHSAFGNGRVSVRIDLSKSVLNSMHDNSIGWIQIQPKPSFRIRLRPPPTSSIWNPLHFFYRDCDDLFECCSLFVTRLRQSALMKRIMSNTSLTLDRLPKNQVETPRWTIVTPSATKNGSESALSLLTDVDIYQVYETMNFSIRVESCAWLYKEERKDAEKLLSTIDLCDVIHVLQQSQILNLSCEEISGEHEIQRLVHCIKKQVMMRYFRQPSDFQILSRSFTPCQKGVIANFEKIHSEEIIRSFRINPSKNSLLQLLESIDPPLPLTDVERHFNQKFMSMLDPDNFITRQKFSSPFIPKTARQKSNSVSCDTILEKVDVNGRPTWTFKRIIGQQETVLSTKVPFEMTDSDLKYNSVYVDVSEKYDSGTETDINKVSGCYESVFGKDGVFCFYRRLNSKSLSFKMSVFEMFIFRLLEHDNKRIVDSEDMLNCIIHKLASLIDKKRMLNPEFPLISVKEIPVNKYNLPRPIGVEFMMFQKVRDFFSSKDPADDENTALELFLRLLNVQKDQTIYHRIWRRAQFKVHSNSSEEVNFEVIIQPGREMRQYINQMERQNKIPFHAQLRVESDMYQTTKYEVPVSISVISRDQDEDLRIKIEHQNSSTKGYPFTFKNALDIFYVAISVDCSGQCRELDKFCVAMNLDRVTAEPCDKSFNFVGYPFLYAYSLLHDSIFSDISQSNNLNFTFRNECFLITGIPPDFQRTMGFTKSLDTPCNECNHWLQPGDDIFFHSDSSENHHNFFQRPRPGTSFYVADAAFFDRKFGISSTNNSSGIWRLDVEFQDFYRCLSLRFLSLFRAQDDFVKDETLSLQLFVDCILDCHGSISEHSFKTRIHSAIKLLDEFKRKEFGKWFQDPRFKARLQLVSLTLCTKYVKSKTNDEFKEFFRKGKAKLVSSEKLDSKAVKIIIENDKSRILGQRTADYDCLLNMPMHQQAMLVFLIMSNPNVTPRFKYLFADPDIHGCSTFLSYDENNVSGDVVNLANAFVNDLDFCNLLWQHDKGLTNGRIKILPVLSLILRQMVPMRHCYPHFLPFDFVSIHEISMIFDDFSRESDRIIFESLDHNDYRCCRSFQRKLLQNSFFYDIKQAHGKEQKRCKNDVAVQSSDFLKTLSAASVNVQQDICYFLSLFSVMHPPPMQEDAPEELMKLNLLKRSINEICKKDQEDEETNDGERKCIVIINVCSEQGHLLGSCFSTESEASNVYDHSASFDCMKSHEILGKMFITREKEHHGTGGTMLQLLLSFCCASIYKALSDFVPLEKSELSELFAKALDLNGDLFSSLHRPCSTITLFSLFDAITDVWAVTFFKNARGRPFVFVIDNVDWLDYHHFKIKIRNKIERNRVLDKMRDHINEKLFGGTVKVIVEYNTSRLVICGDVDYKSIENELKETFSLSFDHSRGEGIKYLYSSESAKNFEEFILMKATRFEIPVVKFVIKSSTPMFIKAFKQSQVFSLLNVERRSFIIDRDFFAVQNLPEILPDIFNNTPYGKAIVSTRAVVTFLEDISFDQICQDLEIENDDSRHTDSGTNRNILEGSAAPGQVSPVHQQLSDQIVQTAHSYLQEHNHNSFGSAIRLSLLGIILDIREVFLRSSSTGLKAHLETQRELFEFFGQKGELRVFAKQNRSASFLDEHYKSLTKYVLNLSCTTHIPTFEDYSTILIQFQSFCKHYGPENFCRLWSKRHVKYSEEHQSIYLLFRRYLLVCFSTLTVICRSCLKKDPKIPDVLNLLRHHTHQLLAICQLYFPPFHADDAEHVPFQFFLRYFYSIDSNDSNAAHAVKKLERSFCFDLLDLFFSISLSAPAYWFIFLLEGMRRSNSPLVNSRAPDLIQKIIETSYQGGVTYINHRFLDPASYMFSSSSDFLGIQRVARDGLLDNPSSAVVFAKNWLRVCNTVREERDALNWISSLLSRTQRTHATNLHGLGDLWHNFCETEVPKNHSDSDVLRHDLVESVACFSEAFENWIICSSDDKKPKILKFLIATQIVESNILGHLIKFQPDAASAFKSIFSITTHVSLSVENCNELLKKFECTDLMVDNYIDSSLFSSYQRSCFASRIHRVEWATDPIQREMDIVNFVQKEQGDIIVSAPHGSGKTSACVRAIVEKMTILSETNSHPPAALFVVPEWAQEHFKNEISEAYKANHLSEQGFDVVSLESFETCNSQTRVVFLHWAIAVSETNEKTIFCEMALLKLNARVSALKNRPQIILSCWRLSHSADAIFKRVLRTPAVISFSAPPISFTQEVFIFDPPSDIWSTHELLKMKLRKGHAIVFVNHFDVRDVERQLRDLASELSVEFKFFGIDNLNDFMSIPLYEEHVHILLAKSSLAGYQLSHYGNCQIDCVINYQVPDALDLYECNSSTGSNRGSNFSSVSVFTFLRTSELILGMDRDLIHEILSRLRRFPEKHAHVLLKFEEHLSADMQSHLFVQNRRIGDADVLGSICFVVEMLRKGYIPNVRTWTFLMTNIFSSSISYIKDCASKVLQAILSESPVDAFAVLKSTQILLCNRQSHNDSHPLQQNFFDRLPVCVENQSCWTVDSFFIGQLTKISRKFRNRFSFDLCKFDVELREFDEQIQRANQRDFPRHLPKKSTEEKDYQIEERFMTSCKLGVDPVHSKRSMDLQRSFGEKWRKSDLRDTASPSPTEYRLFDTNGVQISVGSVVEHRSRPDRFPGRFLVVSLWDDDHPGNIMCVPENNYEMLSYNVPQNLIVCADEGVVDMAAGQGTPQSEISASSSYSNLSSPRRSHRSPLIQEQPNSEEVVRLCRLYLLEKRMFSEQNHCKLSVLGNEIHIREALRGNSLKNVLESRRDLFRIIGELGKVAVYTTMP